MNRKVIIDDTTVYEIDPKCMERKCCRRERRPDPAGRLPGVPPKGPGRPSGAPPKGPGRPSGAPPKGPGRPSGAPPKGPGRPSGAPPKGPGRPLGEDGGKRHKNGRASG